MSCIVPHPLRALFYWKAWWCATRPGACHCAANSECHFEHAAPKPHKDPNDSPVIPSNVLVPFMMSLTISVVDYCVFLLFAYLLAAFRDYRRRRGLPYPPGPRSWPIVGNLFDVPKHTAWASYANMSKKYGDVMSLHMLGQTIVVLGSAQATKDLLEKRGDIYSDRAQLPIQEMMELDWPLHSLNRAEPWREGRRILDRSLKSGAIASYHQMIQEKIRSFLGQLLESPENFKEHAQLLQGRIIMALTYGYDLKTLDDEIILAPIEQLDILSRVSVPGAVLVNTLPFLRHIPAWVPWFNYGALARKGRDVGKRSRNEPFNFVKTAMKEGTAVSSLASECMHDLDQLAPTDRQKQEMTVTAALGSMFVAGSDTTVSALLWFFLALVLNPDVQSRAQAELDAVTSRDRLPTFDDKPRLPYVEAICKELMRWQMITPIAFPHALSEDDVYRGYFIPKGSIVIPNTWAILHDPEAYPDPDTFSPERFLNEDGSVRDDPALSFAFGVGRRICPGRYLVDATLFIVVASVLSVFNLTKAKDKYGHDIPIRVAVEGQNGIIVSPDTFECSITPRGKLAEDLVLANGFSA
ncbi:cytochrome P450 [Gloeopeniophorella convolvens]|nr:cytochrome P450 [Gloeopeniophorella convolvens]